MSFNIKVNTMLKNINLSKVIILIAAIIIIIGITSCSNSSSPTYSNNTPNPTPMTGSSSITIKNTAFSPASITVSKGTTVTWTNNDNYLHNVTSGAPGATNGLFSSANLNYGQTFSYTFNTAGTFPYFCSIHSDIMKGQVIVQ